MMLSAVFMPSSGQKPLPKQTVLLSGPCYAVMGTAVGVAKPNKKADAVERPTQITELN